MHSTVYCTRDKRHQRKTIEFPNDNRSALVVDRRRVQEVSVLQIYCVIMSAKIAGWLVIPCDNLSHDVRAPVSLSHERLHDERSDGCRCDWSWHHHWHWSGHWSGQVVVRQSVTQISKFILATSLSESGSINIPPGCCSCRRLRFC